MRAALGVGAQSIDQAIDLGLDAVEADKDVQFGEDIVERVPMPPDITETLKDFVNRYHQEEEFKKRRRDKLDLEDHKFGKDPIFLQREKPAGGNLDG